MSQIAFLSFVDDEISSADAGVVSAFIEAVERLRHSAVIDRFVMLAPASGRRVVPAGLDCAEPSTWEAALPEAAEIVVGQEISRPVPPAEVVTAVVAAVRSGAEVAVATGAVTDTIKLRTPEGLLKSTVDRNRLREIRPPWACRRARLTGPAPADPAGFAALPWTLGGPVTPVETDAVGAAVS